MGARLYTAIINIPKRPKSEQFLKYRNIRAADEAKFVLWVIDNVPGADHINFYEKNSRAFVKQVKVST